MKYVCPKCKETEELRYPTTGFLVCSNGHKMVQVYDPPKPINTEKEKK